MVPALTESARIPCIQLSYEIRLLVGISFTLVCSIHSVCIGQKKFELGLRFDPYCIPINTGNTIEKGLGYYEVSGKAIPSNALYMDFIWWPSKHVGLSVGGAIHGYKYETSNVITNPIDETEILRADLRAFSTLAWGPTTSVAFRKNRWRSKLSLFTAVEPFREKQSHASSNLLYFVFDPASQQSGVVIIDEDINISPFQSSYSLFQIMLQREINTGLFIVMGFESSWKHGLTDNYRLHVTGHTVNTSDDIHELNDFHLTSKYQAFVIGVSYMLGFGSYKETQ